MGAAAAALDYVMFEGARLPLFAESHLRTLDRIRLREHAQLIYRTLGSRYGILAPELYDGDLAEWILQVQGRHLEPLKTKTSYMDAYGDKVTKTTSTDIFGDRKTTTSVRDAFGDTSKTTTYSDPYGDKITTKTSTDIFSDRKTTRTVRDAFGDTSKRARRKTSSATGWSRRRFRALLAARCARGAFLFSGDRLLPRTEAALKSSDCLCIRFLLPLYSSSMLCEEVLDCRPRVTAPTRGGGGAAVRGYAYVFHYSCIVQPCCAKRHWIAGRARRRQEVAVARLFADVA